MQILTSDTKISETVNTPKVSPKYLLILFRNASEVDNEKYENPGVKSIRLDNEGDSNVISQNGLKEPELYNEAHELREESTKRSGMLGEVAKREEPGRK